jgi:hypothetical protein
VAVVIDAYNLWDGIGNVHIVASGSYVLKNIFGTLVRGAVELKPFRSLYRAAGSGFGLYTVGRWQFDTISIVGRI